MAKLHVYNAYLVKNDCILGKDKIYLWIISKEMLTLKALYLFRTITGTLNLSCFTSVAYHVT